MPRGRGAKIASLYVIEFSEYISQSVVLFRAPSIHHALSHCGYRKKDKAKRNKMNALLFFSTLFTTKGRYFVKQMVHVLGKKGITLSFWKYDLQF